MKARIWIAVAASALAVACGDDSSGTPDAGAPKTGTEGASCFGNGTCNAGLSCVDDVCRGVDASTPSKDADMDAGVAPVTIMCKAATCEAPPLDVTTLLGDAGAQFAGFVTPDLLASMGALPEPCCFGPKKDTCGVSAMAITRGECVEANQEGKPDETCPPIMQNFGAPGISFPMTLSGCCRPDNKCGVVNDFLGVGCMERVAAQNLGMMAPTLSMADAGGVDAGPPVMSQACVFDPNAGGSCAGG